MQWMGVSIENRQPFDCLRNTDMYQLADSELCLNIEEPSLLHVDDKSNLLAYCRDDGWVNLSDDVCIVCSDIDLSLASKRFDDGNVTVDCLAILWLV